MKKRNLFVLLLALAIVAMMAVTVGAADAASVPPADNDGYVKWIKAELMKGNSIVLDRDIEIDGQYVESIPHSTNGDGTWLSPAIFNVVGEKTVTFDLNGKTITYHGHEDFLFKASAGVYKDINNTMQCTCGYAHGIFFANGGGKLTIIDSSEKGTGQVIADGKASAVYAASPGSVITIEGGTWMSKPCATCKATGFFLYASHGGELYINDGVFGQEYDEDDESYLYLYHGGEYKNTKIDFSLTKLAFSGGKYIGRNPEDALFCFQTADNKQNWSTISVVADGCMSFDNGDGSYTVAKPCAVSTAVTPADADVTVTNAYGKVIAPDADGTYTLAAGETYTCSASHADYEPASVEFTAADQAVVTLDLERIPEPEETNPAMLLFLKLYLRKFTVTATAGEGGTITPEGETSYHYSRKNVYTYTITPDEGYVIADVLLDGESIGAVESYDFVQLKKDHTIEAIFEKEAE